MTEHDQDQDNFPGESENTDYNLDDEYKEEPLAPVGTYFGVIRKISFNSEQNCIVWEVVANGNEGIFMSDGKISLNGSVFWYRNWLPNPGDENLKTKSGRSTKRQAKINMLKRFQDDMDINMNTPEQVRESIMNQDWLGLPVLMTVGFDEYQGQTRNVITKMVKTEEEIPMPSDDDDIPF